MAKSKQENPQGTETTGNLPQQQTDPQSEFSVNESLKQSSADDRMKEQHDTRKKAQQQQSAQEDSGRSSESEFSVSQRRDED